MCKYSSSSEPKQPQWCNIIYICFITCCTATAEVFGFFFGCVGVGWFVFNSPFKWKYLAATDLRRKPVLLFLGFLYAGGDCYTYRECSMKVSQRITVSNFQTFHFQRSFLHQNFFLSCINRQLTDILGTIMVADILNVHESTLLSVFCAQSNCFVRPRSPPALIGTATSMFCDHRIPVCAGTKLYGKYSQYNAAASLFKSLVSLHYCSVLYLSGCCLFLTTFVFRYLTYLKVSYFFMDS